MPRGNSSLSPAQLKTLGQSSLFAFSRLVLGYDRMMDVPHKELCDTIQGPEKKKLILMPRGLFKTSLVSIAYPVWRLNRDPDLRVLVVSEVYAKAVKILREIKGHYNPDTKHTLLFGDRKTDDVWKEDEILLKGRVRNLKEASITAAGLDTLGAGAHYDLIIVDDPQSNLNTGTPDQLDKVWEQFLLMLSLLEPNGELIVVMTRWHRTDIAGRISRDQKEDWLTFFRTAYKIGPDGNPSGDPLCPTVLSAKFLQETRRAQGPYIFSGQYLNNPIPTDEAKFMPSWIRRYKKAPENLRITMTVDPASRIRKSSDYTVFFVQGMDVKRNRYVLDIVRDKMSPNQTIETMFALLDKWKPVRVGFESVGFQETYRQFIEEERRRRGYTVAIEELHPKAFRKEDRISRLIPFYENSLIMWPEACVHMTRDNKIVNMMDAFLEEYESFPNGEHDDIMDTQAYQMEIESAPDVPRTLSESERTELFISRILSKQGTMSDLFPGGRKTPYEWAE